MSIQTTKEESIVCNFRGVNCESAVPSDMIGRVIGKGGGSIKSVRQASGARIEVDDKADRDECIISITSTESMDDMKSIAVEAVFIAAREDK